jgi:hypothetical protein
VSNKTQLFDIDILQYDWRCPGCGAAYSLSVDGTVAIPLDGMGQRQRPDSDGYFACCNNRFRWVGDHNLRRRRVIKWSEYIREHV